MNIKHILDVDQLLTVGQYNYNHTAFYNDGGTFFYSYAVIRYNTIHIGDDSGTLFAHSYPIIELSIIMVGHLFHIHIQSYCFPLDYTIHLGI